MSMLHGFGGPGDCSCHLYGGSWVDRAGSGRAACSPTSLGSPCGEGFLEGLLVLSYTGSLCWDVLAAAGTKGPGAFPWAPGLLGWLGLLTDKVGPVGKSHAHPVFT